jgi:hypothetical protein
MPSEDDYRQADILEPDCGTKTPSGTPAVAEVPDFTGGPSRTRTLDPLIKSQLLYQLS